MSTKNPRKLNGKIDHKNGQGPNCATMASVRSFVYVARLLEPIRFLVVVRASFSAAREKKKQGKDTHKKVEKCTFLRLAASLDFVRYEKRTFTIFVQTKSRVVRKKNRYTSFVVKAKGKTEKCIDLHQFVVTSHSTRMQFSMTSLLKFCYHVAYKWPDTSYCIALQCLSFRCLRFTMHHP